MKRLLVASAIAYLVKGHLEPRANVDVAHLTGPFDRVDAKNPVSHDWDGVGGGEVQFSLNPDEYIALEINVPDPLPTGPRGVAAAYAFKNVANQKDGGAVIDIQISRTEGDFSKLTRPDGATMHADDNPQLWYRTGPGTGFYFHIEKGGRYFVNIKLHPLPGGSVGPKHFILEYMGATA